MSDPLFLTPDEVAELTGIRNGKDGRTREQLQADWLRANRIQHVINARGAPVVYRAQFVGQAGKPTAEPSKWTSNALRAV